MHHSSPLRRSARWSLLAAAAVGIGCTPSKTITVRSTPDAATLFVYRVTQQGEQKVPLDDEQGRTPATVKLDFPPDTHYRVEAHRVLCAPSHDTQVRLSPADETDYAIKLTQFKQFVDGLVYAATKAGDIWQLRPGPVQTTATIDTAEPSLQYVDQPVPVTDNQQQQSPHVDFPSFAVTAGPSGTTMVYERTQEESGGLDAKLFLQPLTPGTNPTTLTTNHAQQHNPTFSYSGEDVVFDTDDNARTRSPVQFRAETNEASLSYLQHDADTAELQFSAGRDALAFTAFAPNTAGPDVMVSALDGSGLTRRARGMSPQIAPDQNRIAYVHRPEAGGHLRLATVNVRGPITTAELQLDPDHDVRDPHWSPDGRLIVYCSDLRTGRAVDEAREPDPKFREPDATHSFLWLVAADGRNPIQLTHGENFDSHPVFDPNGRTIYFRSNRGGTWNIWKCNLSDAAMTKVTGGR